MIETGAMAINAEGLLYKHKRRKNPYQISNGLCTLVASSCWPITVQIMWNFVKSNNCRKWVLVDVLWTHSTTLN